MTLLLIFGLLLSLLYSLTLFKGNSVSSQFSNSQDFPCLLFSFHLSGQSSNISSEMLDYPSLLPLILSSLYYILFVFENIDLYLKLYFIYISLFQVPPTYFSIEASHEQIDILFPVLALVVVLG